MGTKENHSRPDYKWVAAVPPGEIYASKDSFVEDFSDYPTIDSLSVSTNTYDGNRLEFNLETRPGDKIWCVSSGDSFAEQRFVFGGPLRMGGYEWVYQAMNELAGGWVNNSVLKEKHYVFFAYLGEQDVLYKASSITHPLSLDKSKDVLGFKFSTGMASNRDDLVSNVLIEKVVNGQDVNEGCFCINTLDNSVQRIDKEWYFTWRNGCGYESSMRGDLPNYPMFGTELIRNESDLMPCADKLVELGKDKGGLEAVLDNFIHNLNDSFLKGINFQGSLEIVKTRIMDVFSRRFNREFISECVENIISIGEKSKGTLLLVGRLQE